MYFLKLLVFELEAVDFLEPLYHFALELLHPACIGCFQFLAFLEKGLLKLGFYFFEISVPLFLVVLLHSLFVFF